MTSESLTILVSGGTSGIGRAIVEHFAANHHRVLFTGRNASRALDITSAFPDGQVTHIPADFGSFSSVAEAAKQIAALIPRLDVLIHNAGTWEMAFSETRDGIETNFAVNHLSPMLLTLWLLPVLNTESGRIVITSSGAHRRNILDLEDPEWRRKPYDGVATYSQSKLCNLLLVVKLASLLSRTGIAVNAVHPGMVHTELFRNMGSRDWTGYPDARDGARGAIYAATAPELAHSSGHYIYREHDDPNRTPMAGDPKLADQLWEVSLRYLKAFLPGQMPG